MFLDYINFYTAFILIGVLTLLLFFVWRRFVHIENSCQLEEDGVKLLSWGGLLKIKVHYENIESVVLLPFFKFFFSTLHLRCMTSGLWLNSRTPSDVVVIKKRRAVMFGYMVITPKDPVAFVEQLQRRIKEVKATSPQI
jgi:hypothetical protein